jgi:hypothetical protein
MAFSEMSSREKTIIAVLGLIILVALVGIGILVARAVTGDKVADATPEISASTPVAEGQTPTQEAGGSTESGDAAAPEATITAVAAPSLGEADAEPPQPVSGGPEVVRVEEGLGPIAPVMIVSHPLLAGHKYRLEIAAADGTAVTIQGSWGQTATSASGTVAAPEIEFFEGTTPYFIDVVAPVADPTAWSLSVSAGHLVKAEDLLNERPSLVIKIWAEQVSQ